MIERSLSQLYREGLQAQARSHGPEAECASFDSAIERMAEGESLDRASIEVLAHMPHAVAVRRIAAELPRWSAALAFDAGTMRQQEALVPRVIRAAPRMRSVHRRSWFGVAVAAGLAVFVVGLGQRTTETNAIEPLVADASLGATGFTSDDVAVTSQAARMANIASADVLFADPDASLVASSGVGSPDSIFIDNLDG